MHANNVSSEERKPFNQDDHIKLRKIGKYNLKKR